MDDQGGGVLPYPLSANAGATLKSNVKINGSDLYDLESIDINPVGANPGAATTLWVNSGDSNKLYYGAAEVGGSGGDVVGPVSSTDKGIVKFDGTTGKVIQDSVVELWDDVELSPNSVIIGKQSAVPPAMTGANNTGYGWDVLSANTSGANNTAVGSRSLVSNISGGNNVAIGYLAMEDHQSGNGNVAIGFNSLKDSITSSSNIAIGVNAQNKQQSGSNNVAIGDASLLNNTNGSNNTALGVDSLSGSTGSNNIGIGYEAGQSCIAGDGNIYIGNQGAIEADTIRIGDAQTKCFIVGIDNVAVPNTASSNIMMVDGDKLTLGAIPKGFMYFENFATPYVRSIAVANTFYEILPSTTSLVTNFSTKFSNTVSGQLRYDGTPTKFASINVVMSGITTGGASDTYEFDIRKNGVKIVGSASRIEFGGVSDYYECSSQALVSLTSGDYISLWTTNRSNPNSVSIGSISVIVDLA